MIAAWVVRSFREHGRTHERRKLMELPVLPVGGVIVDLDERGVPPIGVACVIVLARAAGWSPGLWPTAVQVRLHPEPFERLDRAERNGWKPPE